jgi:hypothetical protein
VVNTKYKTIERIHNGEWQLCEFEQLNTGDVFRVIDPPGDDSLYTALSRPHPVPNEPGNWALNVEKSDPPTGLTPHVKDNVHP